MKKFLVCICCLCLSLPCWAQASSLSEPSPFRLSAEDAVPPPASTIDLLKQSAQTLGTPLQVAPAATETYTEVNDIPVTPAVAPDTPAVTQAAAVAPVATPKQPVAAPKAQTTVKASNTRKPTAKPAVRKATTKTAAPKTTALSKTAATSATAKLTPKTPEEILQEEIIRIEAEMTSAGTPKTAAEQTAHAELEQMARLLRARKAELAAARQVPEPVAQQILPTIRPTPRIFNPNDYRPGVQWERKDSTRFTIYTQKRTKGGITSSNLGMIFEISYETLRRYIPWMMSDKVRVFVYQDHESYLKFEPNAKAYSRALAYPTRGEIVVYDEPGKQQELKEVFTHELVHIFTQKFFNKFNMNKIVTPAWLDEGLAVLIEDQAYAGTKGGPWNNDFLTLNFQRNPASLPAAPMSSSRMFGSSRTAAQRNPRAGKPLYFAPFEEFVKEDSLTAYNNMGKTQDWYFQAYMMVRFLLNPSNATSPTKRMQFQQFTQLLAQGEQVRAPGTGFLVTDRNGRPVYQLYSVEKALGRAYRYNTMTNFEDAFWSWVDSEKSKTPQGGR